MKETVCAANPSLILKDDNTTRQITAPDANVNNTERIGS